MNIAARANKVFEAGSNNLMELVHLRANIVEGKSQKLFHIFPDNGGHFGVHLMEDQKAAVVEEFGKSVRIVCDEQHPSEGLVHRSAGPKASQAARTCRSLSVTKSTPRRVAWGSKALLPSAARRSSKGCLHGIIPRSSAPLGANPVDSFVRVPDVASLAMNAI